MLLSFLVTSGVRATDGPVPSVNTALSDRTNVYVCDAGPNSIAPWHHLLARAIAHALASGRTTGARIMTEARCGAQVVEFACTAGVYDRGGRVLVCSQDTLLRLLRAFAWYAVRHAERPDEDYEAFRDRLPAHLGASAFSQSGPGRSDPAMERDIVKVMAEGENVATDEPSREERVFQAVTNMTFAAMFGHEASHLESAPPYCAIDERSRTEDSGLWKVLLRVAFSDELYKASSPNQGEIAADRCAARRVRFERSVLEMGSLSPTDQDFVRRSAADILSTALLSPGLLGGGDAVFRINDAYLYPTLRMLALVGEMNAGGDGPTVCGGAAENLVEASQQTFKAASGQGLMPDEMEAAFPKGVIDAWERRADWSPSSFACR